MACYGLVMGTSSAIHRLRRALLAVLLIALPVTAFVLSQRQWLFDIPSISLVHLAPKRYLFTEHVGQYEYATVWAVPFIMNARRGNTIPCQSWAVQSFDDEPQLGGMRVRTGCLLDATPASLPAGMVAADMPGGMYVKLSRTEGGWPRVPVYRWAMERFATASGKRRIGPLTEITALDISRLNEVTMLLPVEPIP